MLLACATAVSCVPPISMPAPDERAPEFDGSSSEIRPVQPIAVGQHLPEVNLVDLEGRTEGTRVWRGRTIALTLIAPACAEWIPCTDVVQRLVTVSRSLQNNLRPFVRFVVVLIGPKSNLDTLRQATSLDSSWVTFTSGPSAQTEQLMDALGVVLWDEDKGVVGHNLITIVMGPDGRLYDRFPGIETWIPNDLLASVTDSIYR